jgi:hypothetical protein
MRTLVKLFLTAIIPVTASSICQAQSDPFGEGTPEKGQVAGGGGGGGGGVFERAAQNQAGGGAPVMQRLQNIVSRSGGSARPLVIRSSEMDPKQQSRLEEDLSVMAHILEKALDDVPSKSHGYTAMGIDVFYASGSNPMRTMYLEGYGALFMLNVNFPLLAPPNRTDSKKEEAETDSKWEEAKQELYGQGPRAGAYSWPAEEFSADRVAKLKDAILEALKSAANIRELNSDDSVTVCVSGGSGGAPNSYTVSSSSSAGSKAPPVAWVTSDGPHPHGTLMTIKVKKSDVDAFSKGKLDLEQFGKKVHTETYAGATTSAGPTGFRSFGYGGSAGGGGFGGQRK